jgi:hypothetical protein
MLLKKLLQNVHGSQRPEAGIIFMLGAVRNTQKSSHLIMGEL